MINRINSLHAALLAGVLAAAGCGGSGGTGGGTSTPTLPVLTPVLTMDSSSADFGDLAVGNSRSLEVTFYNVGEGPLTLQQNSVTGLSFTASGIGAGVTLPPGQFVTLSLTFQPSEAGKASGIVSLASSTSSSPINLSVSGNGVVASHAAQLSWNASPSPVVGYNIYRTSAMQPFSNWAKLNSSPVATTSYTDWDVQIGEFYIFTVTSVSAENIESTLSNATTTVVPLP
jgi:hypothetical protein